MAQKGRRYCNKHNTLKFLMDDGEYVCIACRAEDIDTHGTGELHNRDKDEE